MRIVIAEDTVLLREGLAGLLEDAGHEVVARVGNADALLTMVAEHQPELALVDVRMPPSYEDEGARAAYLIRQRYPATAVLVLSQHIETPHAIELLRSGGGFGYLLKDRVLDVDDFLDAVRRVAAGGSALDPEVVAARIGVGRSLPVRAGSPGHARAANTSASESSTNQRRSRGRIAGSGERETRGRS